MAANVGNVHPLGSGNTLKRRKCIAENEGHVSTPVREGKKRMISAMQAQMEDNLHDPKLRSLQPEERFLMDRRELKKRKVIDLDDVVTLRSSSWDYAIDHTRCMARIQKRNGRIAVQCTNKRTHDDLCRKHSVGELYYGRIDSDPPKNQLEKLSQLKQEEERKQLVALKKDFLRQGLQFFASHRKRGNDNEALLWASEQDAQEGIVVSGHHCRVGDFVCVQPNTSKQIHFGVTFLIARIVSLSFVEDKAKSVGQVEVRWYIQPHDNVLFRDVANDRHFERQEIVETQTISTIAVECIIRKLRVFSCSIDEFSSAHSKMIDRGAEFFCRFRFDQETYDFDECTNDEDKQQIEEVVVEELSVIRRARAALQLSNIPDYLLGREEHMEKVLTFVEEFMDSSSATSSFLIYGVPGTGKTAVVDWALRESNVDHVRLNGMHMESPRQIWTELAIQLKLVSPHATGLASKKLAEYFEKNKEPLIIMIDEIDAITRRWGKSQYDLFDWPNQYENVALIAISNTMDLPYRLPKRMASRLRLKNLGFKAYDMSQLKTILKDRLKDVPELFEDQALRLVCARVGSVEGDVRRALRVCNQALDILHTCNIPPPVKPVHIERAMEKIREIENFQLSAISSMLDPITKSLLIALLQDLRLRKADVSTMAYLREQYMTITRKWWRLIDTGLPDPSSITGCEWSDIIASCVNQLVNCALLEKVEIGPRRAKLAHQVTGKPMFSTSGCQLSEFDSFAVLVLKFSTVDVIHYLRNVMQDPLALEVLLG